jgi:FkbM family methyltransferase
MVDGVIVGDEIGRYEAGNKFRPVETIDFVEQAINDRWNIRIPRCIAEYHGWWDTWEKERHLSMAKHLKPGMSFFDVGTCDGWEAVVYSQMLGGAKKMMLIEPSVVMWPNIKLMWEKNRLAKPLATYCGFASDVDSSDRSSVNHSRWPREARGDFMKGNAFMLMERNEHAAIPRRKLDTLASQTFVPDAISIDVEGAELLVLRGAQKILEKKHPLVWASIHPEFIKRFGHTPDMLHEFMTDCGYSGEYLGNDHEDHYFFKAKK